jgi:hypothetical protein
VQLRKEVKPKVAKKLPKCIFYSLIKFSDVLMNDLPKSFPPYEKANHKIKMMHGSTPPNKHHIG